MGITEKCTPCTSVVDTIRKKITFPAATSKFPSFPYNGDQSKIAC